jgi:hypothetical protein
MRVWKIGNYDGFLPKTYILFRFRGELFGGNMTKNGQFERLNKNYDELETDKKDRLLEIGENLLNIQGIVNQEKNQKSKPKREIKKLMTI